MSQRTRSDTIPNPTALFGTSLFQPSELHFVRDHLRVPFPLRTLHQWQPLAALLTSSGSFLVPKSVPWGTQVFINLSHFWEGMALMLCWSPCVLSGWNQDTAVTTKREKNLFPRAWANKLHLSKYFRGLLKILPLACWKATRKTESFLPLLVQYVYIYIVWIIYIYLLFFSLCFHVSIPISCAVILKLSNT